MLGFLVPFKSKAKSKDWQKDSRLLRHTLMSLLNQTNPQFRCFVVYTDLPEHPIADDRVEWVHFPFTFLELDQLGDRDTFIKKYKSEKNAALFYDQGKRALYGCQYAKKAGCKYVMMFDADDLVSNRLAGFVNSFDDCGHHGWFVDKGYIYRFGKLFLQKVPKGMNQMHGSVNIVRTDLVPTPDFQDTCLETYVFFAHHTYLRNLIETRHGKPLERIPFYATIYIVHDTGWSTMLKDLKTVSARNILKKILRARRISRKVREEFQLAY